MHNMQLGLLTYREPAANHIKYHKILPTSLKKVTQNRYLVQLSAHFRNLLEAL